MFYDIVFSSVAWWRYMETVLNVMRGITASRYKDLCVHCSRAGLATSTSYSFTQMNSTWVLSKHTPRPASSKYPHENEFLFARFIINSTASIHTIRLRRTGVKQSHRLTVRSRLLCSKWNKYRCTMDPECKSCQNQFIRACYSQAVRRRSVASTHNTQTLLVPACLV